MIIGEETFEVIGIFGVCLIFCAKFRGPYFDLPEFDDEDESRGITPMYQFRLENEEEGRSRHSQGTVMVRQPFENADNPENKLINFMVAIPIRPVYRVSITDEIRQPLIQRGLIDNN